MNCIKYNNELRSNGNFFLLLLTSCVTLHPRLFSNNNIYIFRNWIYRNNSFLQECRSFFIATGIFTLLYVVSSDVGRKISQLRARVRYTHAWIGTWSVPPQRLLSITLLPARLTYFADGDADVEAAKRISGCPFMPACISTRISKRVLPAIMSRHVGHNPSLRCGPVFPLQTWSH
jgi:hypothetical protein